MDEHSTTGSACAVGRLSVIWLCAALASLSGCVSDQQKYDAIIAVNKEFPAQYEATLAEKGTRDYALRSEDAFSAMSNALTGLGMQTDSVERIDTD